MSNNTENSKNLLLVNNSPIQLNRLNESANADNNKKYVFEGCFTQCSSKKPGGRIVKNRNNRIYYDDEILRHLPYLRDQIKESGYLPGELDHPDRFEVKLSECSHKITDLWYDPNTFQIKGKLELLDTPNGMIARKLVDSGLKLAVSSRAAGSVRNDSSVQLDQIYTYDIVFIPGFQEAHLTRVTESLGNSAAGRFLNESISNFEQNKDNIDNDIRIMKENAILDDKCQRIMKKGIDDVTELYRPLNEGSCEDEKKDKEKKECETTSECGDKKDDSQENDKIEEEGLPQANINPLTEDEPKEDKAEENKEESSSADTEEKKDGEEGSSEKKELTDEEKQANRKLIISIESTVVGEEDKPSEEEREANRDKIVDIEAAEKTEDDKSSSEDNKEGSDEEANENEDGVGECDGKDCKDGKCKECGDKKKDDIENPTDMKEEKPKASNKDLKDKVLNDCDKMADEIKEKTKKDMADVEALLAKAKERKKVKESIYKAYPFTRALDESNFGKFAALSLGDKNKVAKFIIENEIMDRKAINDNWKTPLIVEKRSLKNWLRLADPEDARLFAQQPQSVQDAIEESAKYCVLRNKKDVDEFWAKTGLRNAESERLLRESMAARYRVQTKEEAAKTDIENHNCMELGYSQNYFKFLEDNF